VLLRLAHKGEKKDKKRRLVAFGAIG